MGRQRTDQPPRRGRAGQQLANLAALPNEVWRNVFTRAGLERVLVEELPGIRVFERQRRSWAHRLSPVYPLYLIEGRVPQT